MSEKGNIHGEGFTLHHYSPQARFMIYQWHTPPLWQKDEIFKMVYKPTIAKTVYTSKLHCFYVQE